MKHSCTNIRNGLVCPFLSPMDYKEFKVSHGKYICRNHNMVLFPDMDKKGAVNEKMLGIKPLYDCPEMQRLRKNKSSMHMQMSIEKDQITTWNETANNVLRG